MIRTVWIYVDTNGYVGDRDTSRCSRVGKPRNDGSETTTRKE